MEVISIFVYYMIGRAMVISYWEPAETVNTDKRQLIGIIHAMLYFISKLARK